MIATKTGPASPSWARQSGKATRHQPSEGLSFWAHPSSTLILSVRGPRSGSTSSSSSCASPRSNYLLRTMPPTTTEEFAARHDRAIMGCVSELLGSDGPLHLDDQALQRAKLLLRLGGLGLRSAMAGRGAAYWASWAKTLPRVPELVAAAYHPAGTPARCRPQAALLSCCRRPRA